MTTSPAPINAADREKPDLRDEIDKVVWYQGRGSTSVTDAIMAIVEPRIARVAELEAALAAEKEQSQQYQDQAAEHEMDAEASEARATALLEALTRCESRMSGHPMWDSDDAGPCQTLLMVRAAINAGASDDRK